MIATTKKNNHFYNRHQLAQISDGNRYIQYRRAFRNTIQYQSESSIWILFSPKSEILFTCGRNDIIDWFRYPTQNYPRSQLIFSIVNRNHYASRIEYLFRFVRSHFWIIYAGASLPFRWKSNNCNPKLLCHWHQWNPTIRTGHVITKCLTRRWKILINHWFGAWSLCNFENAGHDAKRCIHITFEINQPQKHHSLALSIIPLSFLQQFNCADWSIFSSNSPNAIHAWISKIGWLSPIHRQRI